MVLTASLDFACHETILSDADAGAAPDIEYSCALAAALLPPSVTEVYDCAGVLFGAALEAEAVRAVVADAGCAGDEVLTADRLVMAIKE